MQNYTPGSAIQVGIELRDESGGVLDASVLRWRVLDEEDTVLQDWTPLTRTHIEDRVEVTILGALNILTPPATRGIRTVELEVTTVGGALLTLSQSVMLQASTQLSLWHNSFMTYNQTLMLVQDLSVQSAAAWDRAGSREDRERALTEACASIRRMPIVVVEDWSKQQQRHDTYPGTQRLFGERRWLTDLAPGEMQSVLSQVQLLALRRAQLFEAIAILDANPVLMARREGLMSMTVGESSQFFRTGKPLDLPVMSTQAIECLKPYLRYITAIGRG